jgi:hypothetical protein
VRNGTAILQRWAEKKEERIKLDIAEEVANGVVGYPRRWRVERIDCRGVSA